jgi:nucleotide-binding universal stress UspA family protein
MAHLIGGTHEPNIGTLLEQGPAEAVMAAYVEKHWPDLVVTGTHGQSGVQPSLIGSVAEGLLKSLSCDVLAVPTAD